MLACEIIAKKVDSHVRELFLGSVVKSIIIAELTPAMLGFQVITKKVEDKLHEPFEQAMVELPEAHVGSAVDLLGQRKGTMEDLSNSTGGLTRLTYRIPTRSPSLPPLEHIE